LTDVLFPNDMAAWRLTEVKAFIDRFDTDVMVVFRADGYSFDWEALKDAFGLHRYDLLILDPRDNRYNRFNPGAPSDGGPSCNGSTFNGALPGRYLLRLRKFGHAPLRVDSETYEWVHHIFLDSYLAFTQALPAYPQDRQSIHLYPGAGFVPGEMPHARPPARIHPDVLLFPTQAFAMDYVQQYLPTNPVVPVYGAAIIALGSKPVPKPVHAPMQPLFVCFTSLGVIAQKGADLYISIAEAFRAAHPEDNVVFIGVGAVPPSVDVVHLDPMPQAALDAFYQSHVDIIFNLERTDRLHGWPLGSEAMAKGAVLFTTDHQNLNERNGFHFGEEVHFVEANGTESVESTIERLHAYYGDRHMLHAHSLAGQRKVHRLFGYDNQMPPLLNAIEAKIPSRWRGAR
jgi:hypothetical protein